MSKVAETGKLEQEPIVIAPTFQPRHISHVRLPDLDGRDYQHARLDYVSGKGKEFHNYNFSYATLHRAYFHGATFTGCKFVGARIELSNFRNASFHGCDFRYCEISGSRIETDEILRNLPSEPNIQRELLQTLRVNSDALGDIESSRQFVLAEIKATKEHLRRAWRPTEPYYRKKYGRLSKQVGVGWSRFKLALGGFLWGHGEKLWMIAVSTLLLILLVAFTSAVAWLWQQPASPTVEKAGSAFICEAAFYIGRFLDVPVDRNWARPNFLEWIVVSWRYVAWGVAVAAMFRILSHR